MTVQGGDVSSWQHPNDAPIDWAKVYAAGWRFVILKATQGTWYASKYFADDYEGAIAAGLAVGTYHFTESNRTSAEAEMSWYLSQTKGLDLQLGRWLDVESWGSQTPPDLAEWVQQALSMIDVPAAPAGLYTNGNGMANMIGAPWQYRLWGALLDPTSWPAQLIEQTGTGTVDGIEGSVDLDTLTNIRAINPPNTGGGVPVPPAPPAPDPPTINEALLLGAAT